MTDPEVLGRLEALALPPAWRHVWASPYPRARIQARGIDSRGRVQYRYSAEALRQAERNKFSHMLHYAEHLPQLRTDVLQQLRRRPDVPDAQQVTALLIRFLDMGLFRVGSEKYVQDNHTYGLTTLEARHVDVHGKTVNFDYIGKESIRQVHQIEDAWAARITRKLLDNHAGTPEDPLFVAAGNPTRRISSSAVNTYIHSAVGSSASAKVARTWGGTVIAAAVAGGATFESPTKRRNQDLVAFDAVADVLGNTPTIARSSYVHPNALTVGASTDVRKAVQQTAERVGSEQVHHLFTDEELQETIRQALTGDD